MNGSMYEVETEPLYTCNVHNTMFICTKSMKQLNRDNFLTFARLVGMSFLHFARKLFFACKRSIFIVNQAEKQTLSIIARMNKTERGRAIGMLQCKILGLKMGHNRKIHS